MNLDACRVCLRKTDLMDFYRDRTMVHDVQTCFQIQVHVNDGMSKLLCNLCIGYIRDWRIKRNRASQNQFKCIDYDIATGNNDTILQNICSQPNEMQNELQPSTSVEHKTDHPMETLSLSEYKNKKGSIDCPFCSHNMYNQRQFNLNHNLCVEHSNPYSCLVKGCHLVFPNLIFFVSHYRLHLQLKKNEILCHECLAVFRGPKKSMKYFHIHEDSADKLNCCETKFLSMTEFVLHTLQNHGATIIMEQNNMPAAKIPVNNFVQLFTCTVENCDKVYTHETNNTAHFRQHSELPRNMFICGVCLCYNSESNYCDHRSAITYCSHCDIRLLSMHDLAKHKLQYHGSVALCGPNSAPGCPFCGNYFKFNLNPKSHYLKCSKKFKTDTARSLQPVTIRRESHRGVKKCLICECSFSSLLEYINHSRNKHNNIIMLKDGNIKLCPVCEQDFYIKDFVDHIKACTDCMRLDGSSLDGSGVYGCVQCMKIYRFASGYQFRVHYMYCKSFREVYLEDRLTPSFICKYCSFTSNNHYDCFEHAVSQCIHYQLKLRYASNGNELVIVQNRIKRIADRDSLRISTSSVESLSASNSLCDVRKQKMLKSFDYLCNICGRGFFCENIFLKHMNIGEEMCRPSKLKYCKVCVSDFDYADFLAHTPAEPLSISVPRGIPLPIKMDPHDINDEQSNLVVSLNIMNSTTDVNEVYDYINGRTYEEPLSENEEDIYQSLREIEDMEMEFIVEEKPDLEICNTVNMV